VAATLAACDPATAPKTGTEMLLNARALASPTSIPHPWVGKTIALVSSYSPSPGISLCLEAGSTTSPRTATCTYKPAQQFQVLAASGMRVQLRPVALAPDNLCLSTDGYVPLVTTSPCSGEDSTSFSLPTPGNPPPTMGPVTSMKPFASKYYVLELVLPFKGGLALASFHGMPTQLWRFKENLVGWL
jgi:hypothetical protein